MTFGKGKEVSRQVEVMAHVKIGGMDETDPNFQHIERQVEVMGMDETDPDFQHIEPPRWINVWFTANVLGTAPEHLHISIPELNYAGWTNVWYTREVGEE